ncbi:MAG: glycosyltransferase [Methanobacteriaceae archaeon]|jgi:glycosyltransferase involved in cell wall biosynthesis|nr:glycosyltransferase [Candidatus Methanorudis spinitermitis]
MKSTKISVIIPVYNSEKYIEQCLDSVLNQTFEDIEVICVDDGSTDNSLNILEKYASEDDRIIIIANEHKGSGAARNSGLKIAKGEYISFIDSDDWVEINTFEELYAVGKPKDVDMVFFKMLNYDEKNDELYNTDYYDFTCIKNFFTGLTYDFHDFKDKLFCIAVSPCNKIYKRNFLESISSKFPEGLIFEDNPFFYHNVLNAKKILLHDKYFYFRRRRKDSVMSSIDNNHFDIIPITNEIINVFKNNNLFEDFKGKLLNKKIILIKNFVYEKLDEKYQKQFFEEIVNDFNEISKDSNQRMDYLSNLSRRNLHFYLNILESKSFSDFTMLNNISNLTIDNHNLKKEIKSFKKENMMIKKRIKTLEENNTIIREKNKLLKDKIELMEQSNSWKISKPIRIITDFFRN